MSFCKLGPHRSGLLRPVYSYRGVATRAVSKMDVTTNIKMQSGYEIPVLGYGVRPAQ